MEVLFTKDEIWLRKWDAYLMQNPRASHLMLSGWMSSYKSYGFSSEIAIILENDQIIGGFGAVLPKVLFFKFYIVPYGPIVSKSYEQHLNTLIQNIHKRARSLGCCYAQFSLPISSEVLVSSHVYKPEAVKKIREVYNGGKQFKYVFCPNGLNWLDLKPFDSYEAVLSGFKSNTRRDIRSGIRKLDDVRTLNDEQSMKTAYDLCIVNAEEGGYTLRDWKDIGPTLVSMVKNGQAKFIVAFKAGEMKGCIFIIRAGRYYTYIFGGTKKEHPDLLTGYALQWEAIKIALDEHCLGYNISLGGSAGVKAFKAKFVNQSINFERPHFNIIIRPRLFRIFSAIEKYVKPHKAKVSKLLSRFR